MTTNPTLDLSNDRPVVRSEDDRLNRAPFADRIAAVLRGLPNGTGLVVGIHGPWGDGKTTVLNLLRAHLSADPAIVVRDFNPWRLTDDDAMLRGFFMVLADAIGRSLSTKLERTKATAEKWASRLRWITKPIGSVWKPAETVDQLLLRLAGVVASGDSVALEQLRTRIVDHLQASPRRIVVLIDDIDRLDNSETHTLFRLIKACADFPNVCYVLAFDDTAVAKALGVQYGAGDERAGRAFLEKIIQIPLKLPVAAKEDLRALCFEQVDRALVAAKMELTRDQVGEFVSGFDRGAAIRLTTPRAAKRFGNGLMFALPLLKDETHPADLLLIEALRAFFPDVYDVVRDNHPEFSGIEERGRPRDNAPRSVQLLASRLDSMSPEEAAAAKAILIDLFPRLSGAYGSTSYGSDWLGRWYRNRRISSPEYCARYFSYAIPLNDVADATIKALLDAANAGDVSAIDNCLRAYLTGSRARRMIEKLRGVEATVTPEAAKLLSQSIAGLANNIPNPPSLFGFAEPPSQAAMLVSRLIDRIPSGAERSAVARRAIEVADPLWFGVECVRWLYVTDEPEKQHSNTLTKGETAEVRRALVERIKARAATGAPLFDPDIPQEDSLLFEWWRVEGRDPVQAHLIRIFEKDPAQILRFLQSQAPLGWGAGDALPRVSDLDGNQLKNIKLLIDLDILADLIRKHCPGDFDNPEWFPDTSKPLDRRLAEQFMHVYKKWRKDGEPPDHPVTKSEPLSSGAQETADTGSL